MASPYRSPRHADEVRHWSRTALTTWTEPHETRVLGTVLGPTQVVSLGSGDRVCAYLPGTNFAELLS